MNEQKVLGLDLGTNSIGWAITDIANKKILKAGVYVFPEGVKIEKGVESSKAAERTKYRMARRMKFRRRLRKYETLKVLIENDMCPLTKEELDKWIKYNKNWKNEYPKNPDFIEWQRTDDKIDKNPYYLRAKAVKEKLSKYELGRVFYHLAQRRGFKSSRLDSTSEIKMGEVKKSINELNEKIGDKTLGEYFYELYKNGEKIRNHYTSREEHYVKEFNKICEVQEIEEDLKNKLYNAIFYQRPLKSQKGLVGKCIFEKNKPRCPVSHPLFEKFRMLQFINSIKVSCENNRFLTEEEKNRIIPLFYRKSKPHFEFIDIRNKLFKNTEGEIFNYSDNTNVAGCPVSASLKEIFGDDFENIKFERKKDNKTTQITLHEIWNVLFFFDDEKKIKEWGIKVINLDEDKATKLSKINLKQGYSNLSLYAIKKILPYLEKGLLYTHAVYFANLDKILPNDLKDKIDEIQKEIKTIIDYDRLDRIIIEIINGYKKNNFYRDPDIKYIIDNIKNKLNITEFTDDQIRSRSTVLMNENKTNKSFYPNNRLDEKIKKYLHNCYNIPQNLLDKLYHPSDIEHYNKNIVKDNKTYLDSPITPSIKNPMAMRTLHRLRKLINTLISKDLIDNNTTINIELARELNDRNKRIAIERYNRELEKRKDNVIKILKQYRENPSEIDIEKYILWEEQNKICIYTGKEIGITDFINDNPIFDIEHTIPLSISCDNSMMNKTLCYCEYNRNTKKNMIPSQCSNYDEILRRIGFMDEKIKYFDEQIQKYKKISQNSSDKDNKDIAIQNINYYRIWKTYWEEKRKRFLLKDPEQDFINRDLVNTGVIGRYAQLYLKSVFDNVFSIKGYLTAEYRKLWGLQEIDKAKDRSSHTHHALDAIVLSCIDRNSYNKLAEYYKNKLEQKKPHIEKPWDDFINDVKNKIEEILAVHYYKDNTLKQTKKKLRIKGKIKYYTDKNGNKKPIIMQGRTFRGSLHQETYYGAIKTKDENNNEVIKYVLRKPLKQDFKDIKEFENFCDTIVDEKVREIILKNIKERLDNGKSLKEALSEPIFMNKEKNIVIKTVRCFVEHVKYPIKLKKHRDLSKKEYKQYIYVQNDINYGMIIYKENKKLSFKLFKNIEFKDFYEFQNKVDNDSILYILKKNLHVLLYENDKNELYNKNSKELSKHLYIINGFSTVNVKNKYFYGSIDLIHHLNTLKDIKCYNGVFKNDDNIYPIRQMLHTQINALVENKDFIIEPDGEIKFLNNG